MLHGSLGHRFQKPLIRIFRARYSNVVASEVVLEDIKNEQYKPRNHPGRIRLNTINIPDKIVNSIEKVLQDFPIKSIFNDSIGMCNHLKGRVPPMEVDEVKNLRKNLRKEIVEKVNSKIDLETVTDHTKLNQSIHDKLHRKMKNKVYNWTPMTYDAHNTLVYLVGRSPAEYSALVKIFYEINQRDKGFKPRTLFDFGSGLGTASWAADLFWKQYLFEYYNVDTSSFMNDAAQLILKGGTGTSVMNKRGVFYRQFLPSNNVTYDLVVSAYSLLELPTFETRMETLVKLWNKTEKYLVLVEQGTNGGFKVISEARDFLLQLNDKSHKGHIFSPCPHDGACPRFLSDSTPCNYQTFYSHLSFLNKPGRLRELYSYVVLKKGSRDESDEQWPRIVRDVMIRSKHTICRLCTSNGKLEEEIFTAYKNGKATYYCARSSQWGDRLPITLPKIEKNDSEDT